jgi:putative FmdB family regulatory protein
MPIYEYKCQDCQKRFEKIQKLSDPPCKKCPNCGGKLKKLISTSAIQFKGKGFYITDYAKKDAPAEGKSEGTAKGKETAAPAAPGKGAPAKEKAETIPSDKSCSD